MALPTSYIPRDSIIHKLDPRIKLVIIVCITLLVFIITKFLPIGILFFSLLVLWKISGIPLKRILSYLRVLVFLFLLLIIMQAVFYPGEKVLLEPLIPEAVPLVGGKGNITLEGVLFGLLLCLRVLTLMCIFPVLLATTTLEKITLAMVKLGLPYRIAFTATTAINQLPVLQSEAGVIMDAQKLRGFMVFETGRFLSKIKALHVLVVPLVMGSMRRASMMGIAMDSRAFGAFKKRTFVDEINIERRDWIALAVFSLFSGVILFFSF